jgi:hypothetical protein
MMNKTTFSVLIVLLAFFSAAQVQASQSLKTIVGAYLQIHAQLAVDKIDGVKAPARAIAAAAAAMGKSGEAVAKAAAAMDAASDLKAAREAFGPLTDAVMAAGKAENWKDVDGVKVAYCPMVNQSWLQKEDQIRNPYYGSTMLACGEFKPLR